jgi:hypothetical protein
MDRSSLNALTVKEAAELLAMRREASRMVGGIVKKADTAQQLAQYRDQIGNWLGNTANQAGQWYGANVQPHLSKLLNTSPNYAAASRTGDMGQYWQDTGLEALRNALIGGGIGAGAGGLKSLATGSDFWDDVSAGGLAGAGIGAAGTAAYRGAEGFMGPSTTETQTKTKADLDAQAANALQEAVKQPDATADTKLRGATDAAMRLDPAGVGNSLGAMPRSGIMTRGLSELGGQLKDDPQPFNMRNVLGRGDDNTIGTLEGAIMGGAPMAAAGVASNRTAVMPLLQRMSDDQLKGHGFTPAQIQVIKNQPRADFFSGPRTWSDMATDYKPQDFQPKPLKPGQVPKGGFKAPKPGEVSQFRGNALRALGARRHLPKGLGALGAAFGAYEGSKARGEDQYPEVMADWARSLAN